MKEIKKKREWIKPTKFKVGDILTYRPKVWREEDYSRNDIKIVKDCGDRLLATASNGRKYYIATWNQSDFAKAM